MNKTPAAFVASLTGGKADMAAVRASYAYGIAVYREYADKARAAKSGKYRGRTADEYLAIADRNQAIMASFA